jgi:hypothetical protein
VAKITATRRTTMLRIALALTCATALLTLAVIVPSASARPASRSCGLFHTRDGALVHAKVLRGPASCATTARVLRWYLDSHAPCSGSACVRGHHGWTCASAAAYAFPRLASCTHRTSWVAAYSTAD